MVPLKMPSCVPLPMSRAVGVIVLASVILFAVAGQASAAHYLRLGNGERIHWKSDSTSTTLRTIKLFDNTQNTVNGNRWSTFTAGARTDFDSALTLNLLGQGPLSGDSFNCPIETKGIVVCNWPNYNGLGSTGPYAGLAEFVLIYSTGHLSRGRIRLDDANSGMATFDQVCLAPPANTPGQCGTYAHAVACQELGHEFGLDHVAGNTCMGNGYFADAAFQVHPNTHDYDAIGFNFGHIDGTTSAAASSAERPPSSTGAQEQGTVINPLPIGDCSRRKVDDHIFVERVCGPERRHPDEIRIIAVIPSVTPTAP